MCSTAARASANGSKPAVHHQRIDKAKPRMFENPRKAPNDLKAETLPQPDRALVCADYKIKLHGAEPALSCALDRMCAHRASYASAHRMRRCHVTAICNVRSAAPLVGFQKIGADNLAVIFCDKNFMSRRKPVDQCAFSIHVVGQRVGLASANNGLQNRPQSIGVLFHRSANRHTGILPRRTARSCKFYIWCCPDFEFTTIVPNLC